METESGEKNLCGILREAGYADEAQNYEWQKDTLDKVLKDEHQFDDYMSGRVKCPKCGSTKIIPLFIKAVCTDCKFEFNTLRERLNKILGRDE